MRAARKPYARLVGQSAYACDGSRIGPVTQVLLDDVTTRLEWVCVATGVLGARQKLVPVGLDDLAPAGVYVPFEAELVRSAPWVELRDGLPSQADEESLYRHYRMTDDAGPGPGPHDLGPRAETGRPVDVRPGPDPQWLTELGHRASSPRPRV